MELELKKSEDYFYYIISWAGTGFLASRFLAFCGKINEMNIMKFALCVVIKLVWLF